MKKQSVNLVELNKEVLHDPASAAKNHIIPLLEVERPGLEFLCPMAQAIYLIETGRIDEIDAAKVLETIWCIDDTQAHGTGTVSDCHADVTEIVHHSITLMLDKVEIKLGFESSCEMVYCGSLWNDYLRHSCSFEWNLEPDSDPSEFLPSIFEALHADAKTSQRITGYPTDEGEFIGQCTYSLVSINELPVEGPSFTDSYHEQSWEGLSNEFAQRWDEGLHEHSRRWGDEYEYHSAFCWAHYLSLNQAEELDIPVTGHSANSSRHDYPEWLPNEFLQNEDTLWIRSDEIQRSYQKGSLVVEPSTDAWIALGCGSTWDPREYDPNGDATESSDWIEFPDCAGPLVRIEISSGAKELPTELRVLLPYFQKLFELA